MFPVAVKKGEKKKERKKEALVAVKVSHRIE